QRSIANGTTSASVSAVPIAKKGPHSTSASTEVVETIARPTPTRVRSRPSSRSTSHAATRLASSSAWPQPASWSPKSRKAEAATPTAGATRRAVRGAPGRARVVTSGRGSACVVGRAVLTRRGWHVGDLGRRVLAHRRPRGRTRDGLLARAALLLGDDRADPAVLLGLLVDEDLLDLDEPAL